MVPVPVLFTITLSNKTNKKKKTRKKQNKKQIQTEVLCG